MIYFGRKNVLSKIKVMNGIHWKQEWVLNMKMKIYRMMKRWKCLGGKLESSDKAIRRTINRRGSSYKELFSRCPSIWKTFTTWEQVLGVVGVRFHCLALFTTFDLGLFKNSHTHQSIPESAFCLAILQEKKTVCDQWRDLSKWKLRYESSALILYKELSSPIFQSCQFVRHR